MSQRTDSFTTEKEDSGQVLWAAIDTHDERGALRLDVAVWTRNYGSYLRSAFRASRAHHATSNHPFAKLDPDECKGRTEMGNIVADNEATRGPAAPRAPQWRTRQALRPQQRRHRLPGPLILCVVSLWD